MSEAIETMAREILASPGMGLVAGSSSEILFVQKCELLHLDDQGALKVVAIGRVHPTDDRFVHGCPIIDGFVKVQIDRVVEGCGSTRLLPESCIYGEIEVLKDAKGSFIQWPVKLIKILNKDSPQTVEPRQHFISTPYRPQVVLRQRLLTSNKRFQMKETSIKYTRMHYKMMRLLINCFLRIQQSSMFLLVNLLSLFMLINRPSPLLLINLRRSFMLINLPSPFVIVSILNLLLLLNLQQKKQKYQKKKQKY
ncbi:hypothetical protein HanIR_Chr02g0061921 [Helianthus annuus]|nr:hypothetical protein HanIR_Chr02g0061921 [Helianthus annuus]